ncbi:hypothetical protein DOE76_10635 [Leifsonia sp. ku-ls]|nr:hypothetical protein DOE76_10635 [Leifsonia sp. ku-ls]
MISCSAGLAGYPLASVACVGQSAVGDHGTDVDVAAAPASAISSSDAARPPTERRSAANPAGPLRRPAGSVELSRTGFVALMSPFLLERDAPVIWLDEVEVPLVTRSPSPQPPLRDVDLAGALPPQPPTPHEEQWTSL